MNIKTDIRTLKDIKALLEKLSFHVEKATLENQLHKYQNILNKYRSWSGANTSLQQCIGHIDNINQLIAQQKIGDSKVQLQQSIGMAIQSLDESEN